MHSLSLLAWLSAATVVFSSYEDERPNIVFLMADDLGWANVGYHNTQNPEVSTPNIDYLVSQGLQLNRHYVAAGCSPTRTSFQSGRLPVHVNLKNVDAVLDPSTGVPPAMTCIASQFKTAGYSTYMFGKWDAGYASYKQLPVSRGYDTSFAYLGKSVDYFAKTSFMKHGDSICDNVYIDLWENDGPAAMSMDDIDQHEYVEDIFAGKVLSTIDEMSTSEQPFFLFYASHLPHFPTQIPDDSVAQGIYTDFEDDENQCGEQNDFVFDGYYEDKKDWKCRSILQAQVKKLDEIVGSITTSLKENNLWDKTLIVFTSDNGGSLELELTAGNNYPLRGGKTAYFEGGIRAAAFVSGGYLPEHRRGQIENGMMHIADWWVTFSEMLGVESSDTDAVALGYPDVDGHNMWPLISGQVSESPRTELVSGRNVYFNGAYKLMTGKNNKYNFWSSPVFPVSSSPTQSELEAMVLICGSEQPCLFNVVDDPGEHQDLAEEMPELVESMKDRFKQMQKEVYEEDFGGTDMCPDGVEKCGCWMAENNW
eukprot:CAMPEP_0202705486 /NCGR_PEP_ID=MMETSP1385-20130828/18021_1 /ASSEMBLY_ACC=CAM_ASM_000861 /TAXON_ID=933848 /ORGANISM="Elphidium margaritaceum" /LENGTH=535 /DNA_ID=CAMNT_0049363719 /DNA_START=41 /DNA_END=1645 /DNA_ORIENTATION=-